MEQPACKNLYCLLWFTCEIRTRDTQVSPLLRMSTSFSGEPNGWKGLECWIHHRKTPTARGYPTISLTKLHKSRFNHSSKESWLAKRYTRRIARRSVLVPLLWVGFRVSRKDARKGRHKHSGHFVTRTEGMARRTTATPGGGTPKGCTNCLPSNRKKLV